MFRRILDRRVPRTSWVQPGLWVLGPWGASAGPDWAAAGMLPGLSSFAQPALVSLLTGQCRRVVSPARIHGWHCQNLRHFFSVLCRLESQLLHHASAPDRITNFTPCAAATEQSFFGCRSSSWHRATLQPLPCPASSASREKRTLGLGGPLRCARVGKAVENSVTTTHPASPSLSATSFVGLVCLVSSTYLHR